MTLQEALDKADSLQPNSYTTDIKVGWLNTLDATIYNEVIFTHAINPWERPAEFPRYTVDDLSSVLIAPTPYDGLYTDYLRMKIDEANGETSRYNNSVILFNASYDAYRKFYHKTHMPISMGMPMPHHHCRPIPPSTGRCEVKGMTDNITADLIAEETKKWLTAHPEAVSLSVEAYLKENPIEGLTEADVTALLTSYITAHKAELKGDPGEKGADGINGADGRDGKDGQDYVITASDYDAIADVVLTKISSAEGVTF